MNSPIADRVDRLGSELVEDIIALTNVDRSAIPRGYNGRNMEGAIRKHVIRALTQLAESRSTVELITLGDEIAALRAQIRKSFG